MRALFHLSGIGLLLTTCALFSSLARADSPATSGLGGLPLDSSGFTDPNSLLTESIVSPFVKLIGFATDHRPYEPATPLGTAIGLDVGLDVTIMKIPADFNTALESAGMGGGIELPVLPVPRLHVHKGFGPLVDVGFAFLFYTGYLIYGGDFKIAWPVEEGPTFALRGCISRSKLGFLSTQTITPQFLVSKKMDFADPYIGIGYMYSTGDITITVPLPAEVTAVTGETEVSTSGSGSARSLMAFLGVQFRVPWMGLQLTLEGSYSQATAHTLGTKIGFAF